VSDTTITLGSMLAAAQPYFVAIFGAIVTGVGGILVAEVKRYTGIAVDQALLAKVEKYIDDKAAQEIAKATDNLATKSIDVHSPMIADLVTKITGAIPEELHAVGLDPVAVAHKLVASFGRLQASMTAVAPPPKPN